MRLPCSLPLGSILLDLLKLVGSALSGTPSQGMYEVLEYESTMGLLDGRGERARFSKRQKVRYLQDNIIAYQDQTWSDGEILLKYRCSPGVPVDRYRPWQKPYILISLWEVKHRGDVDEFHIQWQMRKCFLHEQESGRPRSAIRLDVLSFRRSFLMTGRPYLNGANTFHQYLPYSCLVCQSVDENESEFQDF
jgi:hypothetical protein